MDYGIEGRWEGSLNLLLYSVSRSYTFDGDGPLYRCTLEQYGPNMPRTSTQMSAEVVGRKVKLENLNPVQGLLGAVAGVFGFGPQTELVIEGNCNSLRLDTTVLGRPVTLQLYRVEGTGKRDVETSRSYQEVNCADCNGTGKVKCMACIGGWVKMGDSLAVCTTCGGTKKFKCLSCKGTGKRKT